MNIFLQNTPGRMLLYVWSLRINPCQMKNHFYVWEKAHGAEFFRFGSLELTLFSYNACFIQIERLQI